ncbi:cleavage and polyadenylation specificity factor subunit 3, partial [Plakobranchus ocellatus]
MSTVSQKMSVMFSGTPSLLAYYLNQLAGDIEYLSNTSSSSSVIIQVFGSVTITLDSGVAYIEWTANPVTDMYADAVIAVILRAEQDPIPMK